jgi:hypothetical protein
LKEDLGLRYTDAFLEVSWTRFDRSSADSLQQPIALHSLIALVSNSPSFYPRFYALQFLSQLLTSRPILAQSYIMSAPPPGVEAILSVLDPRAPPPAATAPSNQPTGASQTLGGGAGEMLRNEALLLLPAMLNGNADIQKIVAFSGAFEKLFDIIGMEGGTDGGIVVQDALTVVGCLLRFNVSNQVGSSSLSWNPTDVVQNYFRELSLIHSIPPILGFPPHLESDAPSPDEFALQFWPEQKIYNAGLVLGLIRMLVGGPGGPNQVRVILPSQQQELTSLVGHGHRRRDSMSC